jgi:WD40 repeat protein
VVGTGSFDGKVWSWNLPSMLLNGPAGGVESVAFSPDGHTLAATSDDHKVWLWHITSPAHPALIGRPLTRPRRPVGFPNSVNGPDLGF